VPAIVMLEVRHHQKSGKRLDPSGWASLDHFETLGKAIFGTDIFDELMSEGYTVVQISDGIARAIAHYLPVPKSSGDAARPLT
jgi:hypothetical protein